jgi:hypothetical protein
MMDWVYKMHNSAFEDDIPSMVRMAQSVLPLSGTCDPQLVYMYDVILS